MCTVTWSRARRGYQLFFNRDELREREPAAPPAIRVGAGVRYIAPADGDAGGTWLATNELGLTLGLLNGYSAHDTARPAEAFKSRGVLPVLLADSSTPAEAIERLADEGLTDFRSFWLFAIGVDGGDRVARWEDGALDVAPLTDAAMPLVSSSFDTDEVRNGRVARFRTIDRAAADPTEAHLAFHAGHHPERGPYSVCMHRTNAQTVSFSWVRVDGDRVRFRYTPDSPCRGRPGLGIELARRHD